MLQKLTISNYAIIDHISLIPDPHLNIVTGETGAGKSIILGALSLILGERADTSVLINKENKCIVEAQFDVEGNEPFIKALKKAELDEDKTCIIRREINTSGKSRAFVNDTPVTLAILNELSSSLVDLHQQFDNLALEDDNFQLDIVDALARNKTLKHEYQQVYHQYRVLSKDLAEKQAQQAQWQKEADYKQFLYGELQQLNFKENEIELAEQQLKQLNASEKIITILQSSRYTLEEQEQPISNEIKRIARQLQDIADVLPAAAALHERLLSVYAETADIASELAHLESSITMDPALMQQLQEKTDIGIKLLKKHGVQTTNELIDIQLRLEKELQSTLDLNEQITQLKTKQEQVLAVVYKTAGALSDTRKKAAPEISRQVTALLTSVGMPNALFDIIITDLHTPADTGTDLISFRLDANKSGIFQPIYKAASGGEMSRIMLCIKSLTARAIHMPTLIFDEVDTGISGEAARKVGTLLNDLAKYHQVICITHQPQVAAKGSAHFFVYKAPDDNNKITTKIKLLGNNERVLAIARMIGGEEPTDAAIKNAKELVEG